MSWVHLWFSLTSFVSLLWSVIVLTHGNMESILYGKKAKCCGRWCHFNRSWARTNQKCMCNSAFHIMCSDYVVKLEPWHCHCCTWSTFVVVKMFKSNSNVLFEQEMAVWIGHIIINDRFPLRYWSWMDFVLNCVMILFYFIFLVRLSTIKDRSRICCPWSMLAICQIKTNHMRVQIKVYTGVYLLMVL